MTPIGMFLVAEARRQGLLDESANEHLSAATQQSPAPAKATVMISMRSLVSAVHAVVCPILIHRRAQAVAATAVALIASVVLRAA